MKKSIMIFLFLSLACCSLAFPLWADCTNILVSKEATTDGSVIITYSADLGGMHSCLFFTPAKAHKPDDPVETYSWTYSKLRPHPVKQVPHTYSIIGLMNEHQLAIGETTTGGRPELNNKEGLLDYEALMMLALSAARPAGRRSRS